MVRVVARNFVGIVMFSLIVWFTVIPLVVSLAVGSVSGILGGLWATCLLVGIALVGLFRYSTTVIDRGTQIEVRPSLEAAIRSPRVGMGLGVVTFGAIVAAVVLPNLAPSTYRPFVAGFARFPLVLWYLVVGLASPELGNGSALRPALRAGFLRFVTAPLRGTAFALVSLLVALATGLTVVTVFVFLPGALGLIAARIATDIAQAGDLTVGTIVDEDV